MKVVHIESGLGNQMLSYCEYLATKKANPADDVFIENIVYDIPECDEIICQWNGYELDRIFGINEPNIRDRIEPKQWHTLVSAIRQSEFWLHNWNWPVAFQEAFASIGINLENMRGDFEAHGHNIVAPQKCSKKTIKQRFHETDLYVFLWMISLKYREHLKLRSYNNALIHFRHSDDDELDGQRLTFKNINSGIEEIEKEIRRAFVFPEINDRRNMEVLHNIQNSNSVAIHVRRGDMLTGTYHLYRFGYFKRCTKYIRKRVMNPVFFIFCDPDTLEWAKNNLRVLGIDENCDKFTFIDWNNGHDSFRDMQLMSQCKHQIITKSSFGWWSSWLNTNPLKITCSPSVLMNTTNHF